MPVIQAVTLAHGTQTGRDISHHRRVSHTPTGGPQNMGDGEREESESEEPLIITSRSGQSCDQEVISDWIKASIIQKRSKRLLVSTSEE